MTSKEAIEKIIADYKFKEKIESGYVYHTEVPFMEAITNIMENLEILEILKHNLHIEKGIGRFAGIEIIECSLGSEHSGVDFIKVKEWLKNV